MQTQIPEAIRATAAGREAEAILRSCVHCGFCAATCPTYRLLGDELDGPRGRIYLIKQVLEGERPTRRTQLHLDRCLSCLACETTCPSGVRYRRLLDIGRERVERQATRPLVERAFRWLLRQVLPYRRRFRVALALGRLTRPLLPAGLRNRIPLATDVGVVPARRHVRRVLLLAGCVQPALAPRINAATRHVFDALSIEVIDIAETGCCGALSHHLNAQDEALAFARRNIDAWWPAITAGAEAIIVNASGCGVMVSDYGELLRHDRAYADKARHVSELTHDPAAFLRNEDLTLFRLATPRRIAFQSPCTLQHGLRLAGVTEDLLAGLGFELTPIADAHLCCGSAGTYSLLQRDISQQLLSDKIARLEAGDPELIATANIGCLLHLQTRATRPIVHWLELLQPAATPPCSREPANLAAGHAVNTSL